MKAKTQIFFSQLALLSFIFLSTQSIANSVEQACKQYGGLYNCVQPNVKPPLGTDYIYKWERTSIFDD